MSIKSNTVSRLFIAFALLFLVSCINFVQAQNATSSPYSRYGVGDLNSKTFVTYRGLGGIEIGLNLPGQINYGNPAANGSLLFTTYEGGIDFKQYEFKTNKNKHRTNTASVSYFDFAFPLKQNKWSLGFGLLPYSKVGYLATSESINTFGDNEISQYEGSGGLNNFHIGTGFKVSKRLSFGLNSEYIFGVINNDRIVTFNNPYYYNTSIKSNTSIGGVNINFGSQYRIDSLPFGNSDSIIFLENKISLLKDSLVDLIRFNSGDTSPETYIKKNQLTQEIAMTALMKENVVLRKVKSDWHLVLGLVASPSTDLGARNSTLINSFRYGNSELVILVRDTIVLTNGKKSYVRLPVNTGFGFSLIKGSRWLFGGDISIQQWSNFSYLGAEDSLVNSWKVNAGIQFTPNDRAIKAYWKTIQYRLGFHYDSGFLKLNGSNIREKGITAGFGLPVRKVGTVINVAFDAGERGTTKNNLILERYFQFTFGFTISDRWFIKSKYD